MPSSPTALALSVFRRLPVPMRRAVVRVIAPSYVVGVVAVLTDPAGSVLLLRERHHDGWALPGGLVSRRERTADALVRELGEELGLRWPVESLGAPAVNVDPVARRVDVIYALYGGPGLLVTAREPEVLEARWFPVAEFPELFEPTAAVLRTVGVPVGDAER
jgi:ADP-ribose pyrophosphatase YjhB (NUDIX family)